MSNKITPLSGASGMQVMGAGLLVGVGVVFGVCMAKAVSRPRPLISSEPAELASLQENLTKHAERASQLDHDLRTPISTIATALQWMNTALDEPDSQAEGRQVIGRQVNRLIKLTEELHQLARDLRS